jgi:hypothetical protein
MEIRQRGSFTDDYKRQAVDLVASSGRRVGSVRMSTRVFLILVSGLILTLMASLLIEKYRECREEGLKECPTLGPYVSKSGAVFFRTPR